MLAYIPYMDPMGYGKPYEPMNFNQRKKDGKFWVLNPASMNMCLIAVGVSLGSKLRCIPIPAQPVQCTFVVSFCIRK